jgi:iron-sulfur cluster repair protein YtfE (RIC family)
MSADPRPDPDAEPLYAELLAVHSMLREGLAVVGQLAARTAAGQDAGAVAEDVAGLVADSALWRLRANCLYQCRFVHGHHSLEDALVFPAVRAAAPSLAAEVDRLVSDHVGIAAHLRAVEDAAHGLGDGRPGERRRLVDALGTLETVLLDHLRREEELLRPVLRSMGSWTG